MPERLLVCYITDRSALGRDERTRRTRLLDKIAEAAEQGVDYIQLRERDLCGRELESLAAEAMRVIREEQGATRLLINSRTDVALAAGADGVHLRADDISAVEVRAAWEASAARKKSAAPIISVACHSEDDVAAAARDGASFAVLAPVFEKKDAPGNNPVGLDGLRRACGLKIPVLALGGVALENAESCRQ